MSEKHPTEEQVQQFVLSESAVDAAVRGHIEACAGCRSRVESYRLMFASVAGEPAPSFDFDLSSLMVARVQTLRPKAREFVLWRWVLVAAGVGAFAFAGYFYSDYLLSIFSGIKSLVTYIMVAGLATIVAAVALDMLKGYNEKMRSLDFYGTN